MSFENYDYEIENDDFSTERLKPVKSKRLTQRPQLAKKPQKRHAKLQPVAKQKYRNYFLDEDE